MILPADKIRDISACGSNCIAGGSTPCSLSQHSLLWSQVEIVNMQKHESPKPQIQAKYANTLIPYRQ